MAALDSTSWHPEFAAQYAKQPLPRGEDYQDVETIKELSSLGLPRLRQIRAAEKTSATCEIMKDIRIPATALFDKSAVLRSIIVCPSVDGIKYTVHAPIVFWIHGGGHCIGAPETELREARMICEKFKAIVILPSYRLAPEHKWPASHNDCWEMLKFLAADLRRSTSAIEAVVLPTLPQRLVPSPQTGFIVGGTSAGASLAHSLTFLARDETLEPPLTGCALICGTFLPSSPSNILNVLPNPYRNIYISREVNVHGPVVDTDLLKMYRDAHAMAPDTRLGWPLLALGGDISSTRTSESDSNGKGRRDLGEVLSGLPPTYFQACGLDFARDDTLILEKMLREGAGVATKIDLYEGLDHCWWTMSGGYADLKISQERLKDLEEGIDMLLR